MRKKLEQRKLNNIKKLDPKKSEIEDNGEMIKQERQELNEIDSKLKEKEKTLNSAKEKIEKIKELHKKINNN